MTLLRDNEIARQEENAEVLIHKKGTFNFIYCACRRSCGKNLIIKCEKNVLEIWKIGKLNVPLPRGGVFSLNAELWTLNVE